MTDSKDEVTTRQAFELVMEQLGQITRNQNETEVHVVGAAVIPDGTTGLSLSCGNEAIVLIIHALWERLDEEYQVGLMADLQAGKTPIERQSGEDDVVH